MHARALLLLLLIVALALELEYYEHLRSRHSGTGALVSTRQAQAERALTLLDFWSQSVVPNLLLQRSRSHALQVGDAARAAGLERRIRRGLVQIHDFAATAARDPSLQRPGSAEVRALRAAGAAWAEFASARLRRAPKLRGRQARHVAGLEATAIRLHQAAYDVVDASLRRTVAGANRNR